LSKVSVGERLEKKGGVEIYPETMVNALVKTQGGFCGEIRERALDRVERGAQYGVWGSEKEKLTFKNEPPEGKQTDLGAVSRVR